MSDVVLETAGLTRDFATPGGALSVLRGIDLTVNRGDFVSITGPSGVGKSTLLHILGGLDQPTSGSVKACGQRVDQLKDEELSDYRNKMVGFVFQFHYLLEEFNALENTMMPLLIRGEPWNKSAQAAVKLLKEVGLGDRVDHRPAQLSGGERQRVAVARAMVGAPQLLIADEPTGDLDAETASGLHELFEELNQTHGLTVMVATHDQSLANRAGSRYGMLNGKLARKE